MTFALLATAAVAQDDSAATDTAAESTTARELPAGEGDATEEDAVEVEAAPAPPPPPPPAPPAGPSNEEIARRMDVLAGEVERLRIGDAALLAEESVNGMGPAASKVYRSDGGVSIGGYGEVKYHNYAAEDQAGDDSGEVDGVDVHRMIIYTGYRFNEKWVLNAEIEFEHVKEVYVEFAYLDYKAAPALGARAGLLLVPMGITNEQHEPTTFAAVDRPQVEKYILPSTWREIGAGIYGDLGPVSYRAYLLDGMSAGGFSKSGIRGGRQKGAEAVAEDFAGVARLDLMGVPGLVVGGSAYYGNSGQDLVNADTDAEPDVSTLVYEGHLTLDVAGLRFRALYAGASLGDVKALNEALALEGADSVGESLYGYVFDLGYDVFGPLGIDGQALIPHLRYDALNTQAKVPNGYEADPGTDRSDLTAGLAYQPHHQLTLKADYQIHLNGAESGTNQVNAGVGFIF